MEGRARALDRDGNAKGGKRIGTTHKVREMAPERKAEIIDFPRQPRKFTLIGKEKLGRYERRTKSGPGVDVCATCSGWLRRVGLGGSFCIVTAARKIWVENTCQSRSAPRGYLSKRPCSSIWPLTPPLSGSLGLSKPLRHV
jgi:hypothetical protein